jgi:hypothetical protein
MCLPNLLAIALIHVSSFVHILLHFALCIFRNQQLIAASTGYQTLLTSWEIIYQISRSKNGKTGLTSHT